MGETKRFSQQQAGRMDEAASLPGAGPAAARFCPEEGVCVHLPGLAPADSAIGRVSLWQLSGGSL